MKLGITFFSASLAANVPKFMLLKLAMRFKIVVAQQAEPAKVSIHG